VIDMGDDAEVPDRSGIGHSWFLSSAYSGMKGRNGQAQGFLGCIHF